MFKDKNSKRFKVLTNYGTRMTLKGPDGKSLIDPNTGEKIIVPPHRFKRSAIMTGTPSPNGLRSLWSPFYIIDHGARLHKKFDTYLGRFFHKAGKLAPHIDKYELNDGEGGARPLWEIRDGGPQRIHELIADVTVELNAADYGILPKVLPPFLHYVDLPNEVMQHYKVLEKEALFEMLENPILASNGGAKSMMCWQICNGAIHVTDEYGKRSWKELHSAKLDKLIEIVETLNQNCLIPYYFTHDRDRITARFRKEGIPYTIMPSKNAQDVIDRWNAGRIENLLIHPQSAAHGLNLQFGGYTLIWFSTIWSLERWIQTNGRLGRSGQKGIVSIHIIMANKTTDAARMLSLTINGDEQTRLRQSVLQYQRGMGIDIESIPLPASRNSPFEGVEL
jgi:SNF2 family DNA or RNA helicase